MTVFQAEQVKVIEEARRYLSLRTTEIDVTGWDDDRVLRAINRCYFGGIQRFVKYHQTKRATL